MNRSRLEAFSDGVIAILITIMVLELHVPKGTDLQALRPLASVFFSYFVSFLYLGIYWNNHHHMLHTVDRVNGKILWANLHLLFWLSLIPFSTAWMGENRFVAIPTAFYGLVLMGSALAYTVLQRMIIKQQGTHSKLSEAIGKDVKGKISLVMYAAAIPLAFFHRWGADAIYVSVALIWLIPDSRIEGKLAEKASSY